MIEIITKIDAGLPLIADLFQSELLDDKHRPEHGRHKNQFCALIMPAKGREQEALQMCLKAGAIVS
jgi:hypothetical protein